MEQIYNPQIFGSSELINLNVYFNQYSDYLKQYNQSFEKISNGDDDNESELLLLKNTMDCDLETVKQLSEACSINQLTCDIENTAKYPIDTLDFRTSCARLKDDIIINTKPNQLETVKKKKELEEKRSVRQMITGNKRGFYKPLSFPDVGDELADLKEGDGFILTILVFRQFKFALKKNTSSRLRFNHQILILGRNTLEQLRDKILCSLDEGLFKEVESPEEDLTNLLDARRFYPSGFIFINDTFYNDFRSSQAIDYSKTIIEWAKSKNIGEFKTRSMSNVTINSLELRLGYPYLYMHQGDCEHILIFSDARLLQINDCLYTKFYPHLYRMNARPNRKCFLCSTNSAKWICFDSERLPQNKILLCTNCCSSYNYIDGRKIGKFRLYPYYEKHTI